jgi:hypothetical protein
MKNIILLLIVFTGFETVVAQSIKTVDSFQAEIDSITKNSIINTGFFKSICQKNEKFRSNKGMWHRYGEGNPYKYVSTAGLRLLNLVLQSEKNTWHKKEISDSTRRLLSLISNPYTLVLLDRAIINYSFNDSTNFTQTDWSNMREKLRDEVGLDQVRLNKNTHPFYTYETKKKQFLKFFYLDTGNDLFAIPAKNFDRDYTGSLHIELGTDYLNLRRKMPIKSYQTFMFGLEVFTGNIRNSNPLVDSTDRPFGSFQYWGWGKYVLTRNNHRRYNYSVKVGTIGGNAGRFMQNQLHTDLSYSKVSLGWDNQIVNGGRIAFSFDYKYEWEIGLPFEKFYLQPSIYAQTGSYMTKGGVGIRFSNRNFAENSHHHVNLRNTHEVRHKSSNLKWFVDYNLNYIQHNTMLEGFGILKNKETYQNRNDIVFMNIKNSDVAFSKYILDAKLVRRDLHQAVIGISYTTTYMTLLYKFNFISPETKFNTQIFQSGKSFNLKDRWQKFVELGVSFNLK